MNIEKMKNLAKHLESLPKETFDMDAWADENGEGYSRYNVVCPTDFIEAIREAKDEHPCGTTCCIAGYHQLSLDRCVGFNGYVYANSQEVSQSNSIGYAATLTAEDLELTPNQASKLFYRDEWPKIPVSTGTTKQRFPNTPKGAAKRIRWMIKHGE